MGRPLGGQGVEQIVAKAEPVAAMGLAEARSTSKYATRHAQVKQLLPGRYSSNFCHSVTEVS